MNTTFLFTLSDRVATRLWHATKYVFIVSLLAGLFVACASTSQEPINNIANQVQPSNPLTLPEAAITPHPTHSPGHDFGAIDSSAYPRINHLVTQMPFVYWVGGHMLMRRSEMGPLTNYYDNTAQAYGAGQNLSKLSVASAADIRVPPIQPPITYTLAGQTIIRQSELGPLTGTTGNSLGAQQSTQGASGIELASSPGADLCANQPVITYTIAGVTLTRHSDLGILDNTPCNSLQAGQAQQDTGTIELASYPVASPCADQPVITYTIAGVTLTRHSDLGILDNIPCNSLQAGQAGLDAGEVELASYSVESPCADQPLITYTIAGVTLTRHSDLGPLAGTACSPLMTIVP
jgi:hypothetical protein